MFFYFFASTTDKKFHFKRFKGTIV